MSFIALPCIGQDWVFPLDSADEFTEIPGGFTELEAGTAIAGAIPTGEGNYTDGQGVEIHTAPGQVELLMFPTLEVGDDLVLIRVSVQSTGDGASIALAALDISMDGSIATNIPANSGIYKDGYHRIVLLYDPPGASIVPVFQIANSGEEELTIYLDNLEVFSYSQRCQYFQ